MAQAVEKPIEGDALRSYLAEHDAACPACEYNLRGLTGDSCPECNQRLILRVGLAEPRLGAFVAGLVGIAGGLGFCAILSVYFAVLLLRRYMGGNPLGGLIPLPVGVVVGAGLLWGWLKARGRLVQTSRERRLAAVIVVWVVSAVCPLLFCVLIR